MMDPKEMPYRVAESKEDASCYRMMDPKELVVDSK
jgi:hypothetical protein